MKRLILAATLLTLASVAAHGETITVPASYDCAKNLLPSGMPQTIVTVASGVGSTVTITQTQGGPEWKQTIDTSVANTTSISCIVKQ